MAGPRLPALPPAPPPSPAAGLVTVRTTASGRAVPELCAAVSALVTAALDPRERCQARWARPLWLERVFSKDRPLAQGRWRPGAGGNLLLVLAPDWTARVARPGHAVIDGLPVLQVLSRTPGGLPSQVWVLDISAPPPARHARPSVYLGARPATVLWPDGLPEIRRDVGEVLVGELPLSPGSAPLPRRRRR